MLAELRISNLAVIAEATIEPAAGMTAVTGETGAGKTMIVTGLGLLLGDRADSAVVRRGEDRAIVEARFTDVEPLAEALAEIGAELDDGEPLVSRQVGAGPLAAFVGGVQAPITQVGDRWANSPRRSTWPVGTAAPG